jgi:ABC-type nitrate/sulfonate/bicarbonate transport system substrate-binding protein
MTARKTLTALAMALAIGGTSTVQAQQSGTPLKMGFAKCAHCMAVALVPDHVKDAKVETINFNAGSDVLTALVSKSIDVAQVTYLHLVTALDKGFDVVAISGQVNGGSELLVASAVDVKPADWAGLKAALAKAKADGKPFRVGASRGSAQDIHMRGALHKQGIDANRDIQFINIPNPADHFAALQRGEVDMICAVEPFATQIRKSGVAKHFTLPYDQAAGRLTNIIITRPDVVAARKADVQKVVDALVVLTDKLNADPSLWIETITKMTGLDKETVSEALRNAFPDYAMHRNSTLAIAKMMTDLKYISRDVAGDIEKRIDYSFLEAATKKPKNELGY